MKNGKSSFVAGVLIALLLVLSSATQILGFPNGATDGDKLFSSCSGCHGAAGAGTVTVAASAGTVEPGATIDITVTVTEPALGDSGLAGVFLLKGPAGTQESPTADGWAIVRDPNGGTHNYVEKGKLSAGAAVPFVWTLTAPAAAGTYSVYATAVHGGSGAVSESSTAATITVAAAPAPADTPPVIEPPVLPAAVMVGTVQDIHVRIIDATDGVKAARIHFTHPGSRDAGEASLALEEGTPQDGIWSAPLDVGQKPGSLELYVTATDGNGSARAPADGSFIISVVAPGAPEISAPELPASVETGSLLGVSAPMKDSDGGVKLAVLRYRLPGAADFSTVQMALAEGTPGSGRWTAEVAAGPEPGALALSIEATDGTNDVSWPAAGPFSVPVVRPPGPTVEVEAPASAPCSGQIEIRARAADPGGVAGVKVHYRPEGERAYIVSDMARLSGDARDGEWSAVLPAIEATGSCVFFVVAQGARAETRSADMAIDILADIYVLAPVFSENRLVVKKEVVISAVVGNCGDRPVSGVTVRFLDMSYSVGEARIIRSVTGLTVPAEGQVTVTAKWMPQAEGNRKIAAVVSQDGKATDGNAQNDRAETTAKVALESGMGVKFPIPSPGDMWAQLAVIAVAGTVVCAGLFYGLLSQEKRGRRRAGKDVKGPAGKQG
jgi:hypothetical protein